MSSPVRSPVVVIGGGIVGLSVAWSLLERGVGVTVLDAHRVGQGASWGNAGYVVPGFAHPLAEPALLRMNPVTLANRSSPLGIGRMDGHLARFLLDTVRNCTRRSYGRGKRVLVEFGKQAFEAYDAHVAGGVEAEVKKSDLMIALTAPSDGAATLKDLELAALHGLPVSVHLMAGDEARQLEPCLSERVTHAIVAPDQRYVEPAEYILALAESVRAQGGEVLENRAITEIDASHRAPRLTFAGGETIEAASVVVSTGADINVLARRHGVRTPVVAGRGYSFSSTSEHPVTRPILFPSARIATSPRSGGIGISGVMELGASNAPISPLRFRSMVDSVTPLLRGVDISSRTMDWGGARPLTPDGLPLLGASASPGVYIAGGHGMWGMTLGPLSGRLLAEVITGDRDASTLSAMDPLR